MNLNLFLFLEELKVKLSKENEVSRDFLEKTLKNMFHPFYYKNVISKIFAKKPIEINFIGDTRRDVDPKDFETKAYTKFSKNNFSININKNIKDEKLLDELLTHEFTHVLQKVLSKQDKLWREFERLFKKIVLKGIKKQYTLGHFLLGKKVTSNLPQEEILAYLFNKKMDWTVINEDALRIAYKLLTRMRIFNVKHPSIEWNLRQIRKGMRGEKSMKKRGVKDEEDE